MILKLSELIETIKQKTTKTVQWENPEFLSNLLLELASYYSTLGQFVADAEQDADFAEMHQKVTKSQVILDRVEQGDTVSRAEELATVESKKDKEVHIEKKHKARILFLSRQNLAVTMDAIRSRLSYIKSDKESSKNAV